MQYAFYDNKKNNLVFIKFSSWDQVIREVRKAHSLSQVQLGKELGYSNQQITRYEGGTEPPIDFWIKFSKRFDINIRWLLSGEGPANKQDLADPSILEHISTPDIKAELKQRQEIIQGLQAKIEKRKKELLAEEPGRSFSNLRKQLDRVEVELLPVDAPKWLKEDLGLENKQAK